MVQEKGDKKGDRLLFTELKKRLKGKIAIIGVGNPLKGDDGAGPFFIEELKKKKGDGSISTHSWLDTVEKQGAAKQVLIFEGQSPPLLIDAGIAPENWTGVVTREKPDVIMVVDATSFGESPGEVAIFEMEDMDEKGFTTHTLAPKSFMNYLKQITGADIFLLAIQPKNIDLGEGLTPEVKNSIEKWGQVLNLHLT